MEPRAALISSLLLVGLVGCASEAGRPEDMSAVADMAAFGGRDMGHIGCSLVVDVMAESTPAVAPVTLNVSAQLPGWTMVKWQVQRAGDAAIDLPAGATPLNVSYRATMPGTYTFYITADANGQHCNGSKSIDVVNPSGVIVKYRLRALPSEAENLPLADFILNLTGGEPAAVPITLAAGTPVNGTLRGPDNGGIAGEVRLIAANGPDAVGTAASTGQFSLAVRSDGNYQPLLIPQATTLAPHLGTSDIGANFIGASFAVGAGEPVRGSVVDNGAQPVGNARVVLRAGALPSGVGITAANGMFTLRAEQQTYGLSVGADDWPIATLGGVVVPAGGVNLAVAYTVARLAVAGKVTRADGTTPVAGARVTIASRPLGNVANVTVGAAAPVPAAGRVVRQVISDGAGNLPSLLLPAGTYDLIVDPPADAPEGLTAITKTLVAADSWTLALQPRNTLAGKIVDGSGQGVGGVKVTALELAGLGAAPSTTSASDGSYSLTVDAGAALMLIFEPSAAARLAGVKLSLAAGSTHADVTLPPGLAVTGTVMDPSGNKLSSVIVEALCYDCKDGADTPITSTVTGSKGDFMLYLPDPGNIIVDGGTN